MQLEVPRKGLRQLQPPLLPQSSRTRYKLMLPLEVWIYCRHDMETNWTVGHLCKVSAFQFKRANKKECPDKAWDQYMCAGTPQKN